MSKKSRRKSKQKKQQASFRRLPWPWLVGSGALLLIAGLLMLQPWAGGDAPQATPQVAGAPRLMVDQTSIDEGYVKYNVPVRTAFQLRNVGDQPLQILAEPQVRLVQGC